MRTRILLRLTVLLSVSTAGLRAQGTAFTYQGRLNDTGNPANGHYDLQFTIYDSTNLPGTVIAGPLTNAPTPVSNGLFTVTLDFGAGVFNGNPRWLEIGVRTNGSVGAYSVLSPRQAVTGSPYAITAGISPGLNDGGRYNPVNNAWTAVTLAGARSARYGQSAVWTGSQMLTWGGQSANNLNDTYAYTPLRTEYLYLRP